MTTLKWKSLDDDGNTREAWASWFGRSTGRAGKYRIHLSKSFDGEVSYAGMRMYPAPAKGKFYTWWLPSARTWEEAKAIVEADDDSYRQIEGTP
jgi:hypothetical protein